MATKPTDLPDWDTGDNNNLEPTTGQKTSGIALGEVITRRRFNWMFRTLGLWVRYINENLMDKTNNLSDLSDIPTSRTNLDVYSKTEGDNRYTQQSNNLSDVDDVATARTNLGVESQVAAEAKYYQISNNLSEGNAPTIRTNLGVQTQAENDTRYTQQSNNLSDVGNRNTALENLGIYKGYVDYSTGSIVTSSLPSGWTASYIGSGEINIQHNLGAELNITVTPVVATGALRFSGTHQPDNNNVRIKTAVSDTYQAIDAVIYFMAIKE